MIYEIEITLRTLRREGLGPLLNKIRIYVRQLFCGGRFFFVRLPHKATPTELVDFSFTAGGGLFGGPPGRPGNYSVDGIDRTTPPQNRRGNRHGAWRHAVPVVPACGSESCHCESGFARGHSWRWLSVLEVVDLPALSARGTKVASAARRFAHAGNARATEKCFAGRRSGGFSIH